ncbi:Ku protein (plasmid) [Paracoccus liaowanqingii]|uniref:Non-homologous end joining protein Ku n=1 Tax=Paracoccus liaowanqingii TaxID=2560053 RepID=A0A4Y5SSR0_9RHOB|nr:Ku protein [Paracoccus liaowanqingii]QDA36547.1 Ku protein [Paracoccus liaowanqingii]
MASRAVWKGQLRLSLVAIPVELHPATRSGARVSFRQIHGPSGKPVRYQKTVAGLGPVKAEDILKGYEVEGGDYLLLDPEEIDAIKLDTKKTLELVQFVDQSEIPPLYYNKPYYVVPTDDLAEDAYRVVRDALRAERKTALGQLTMRGREYLCAIRPCGDGLLLETLRYEDEIREAEPLFASIEDGASDADLLEVATQLIRRKSSPFDAEAFRDHYDKALRDLIAAKRKNRKTPRARAGDEDDARPSGGNVVDLMSALKDSLKKDGGKPKAAAKKPARKPRAKPKSA